MSQQNPTFSEVLIALRAEESEPTYSALSRWQERHPQFHNDLVDYFANWATSIFEGFSLDSREEETSPNQRWLAGFGMAYADHAPAGGRRFR